MSAASTIRQLLALGLLLPHNAALVSTRATRGLRRPTTLPHRGHVAMAAMINLEDELAKHDGETGKRPARSARASRSTILRDMSPDPLLPGPQGPIEQDELVPLIESIARAADKRKAEGILAMRVSHLTFTTEFIVIMVGNSRPQNNAIASSIQDEVEEELGRTCKQEGTADSGWMLLDYGDVLVNVMTPRSREYYSLERFWEGYEELPLDHVLLPSGPVMAVADADDQPFWGNFASQDESNDVDIEALGITEAELNAEPHWDTSSYEDDEEAIGGITDGDLKQALDDKAPAEDPFWS